MRHSKGLREPVISAGCDVPGCIGQTHMSWRPVTERLGKKICEDHWRRHRDLRDGFDLFEAFGFKRPPKAKKKTMCRVPPKGLSIRRFCRDCGQPREPGYRYCDECSKKRKAQSNQRRQQRFRDTKRNAFARPLAERLSDSAAVTVPERVLKEYL